MSWKSPNPWVFFTMTIFSVNLDCCHQWSGAQFAFYIMTLQSPLHQAMWDVTYKGRLGFVLLFTHTVKGKAHGVEEIKELNWNDLRLQLLHYYKVTNTKVRLQCDPNFKSVSLIQWLTFKKQQQMVYLINVQNQIKTLELADSSDNLKEIP